MTNRLAQSTSPYLLQHADNPVDWWEWGPEALAEAKRRDQPILLSVGYASCHWCHVMAHESFEDPTTAAYMNANFVNIKVDREERPDIDAIYMRATQAMTGQGGWPMTCVLTPDGEPFFAGTYFPPKPQHGMPSFGQVLQALADAWLGRRDEVMTIGAEVREHMAAELAAAGSVPTAEELDAAAASLVTQFDGEAGGFGGAPKFPPSMIAEFLLRHHARTGDAQSLTMVSATCQAMARGGLYDQLAGGFARYSVDRYWRVPHFEKMLYDNAQLLRLYLHWWRSSGEALGERIARETADFLLAELLTSEGGFASALDADSRDEAGEIHEGAYYVWTPRQLSEVLGPDDGAWAAEVLSVSHEGTFERGFSTLQLLQDPDDSERWAGERARLLDARSMRERPFCDDKVVAGWNGMAITALCEAGVLLEERRFTDAAVRAAELLWDLHVIDGALRRTSRGGQVGEHAGVLEDYGLVAESFIAVLGVTGDARWYDRAATLLDRVLTRFRDSGGPGFFDTADDADELLVRPRDITDNASPSGTSAVTHAFLAMAAVSGDEKYRAAAHSGLEASAELATKGPRFAGWALAAAEAHLAGPEEIAVVGDSGDVNRAALHRAALRRTSPGAVVVAGQPGLAVPLFESKTLVGGEPAAYVCRNFTCALPVTDPARL